MSTASAAHRLVVCGSDHERRPGHVATLHNPAGRFLGVVATPGGQAGWSSRSRRASAGGRQLRVLRGRPLSSTATAGGGSGGGTDRAVAFGKDWGSSPLVFSLLPRCQGLAGSQK